LEELKQEYRRKHAFGLLMGVMVIPATLVTKEDIAGFKFEDEVDEITKMREIRAFMKRQLPKSENYVPRFVGMIEDLVESGFFDEYSLTA